MSKEPKLNKDTYNYYRHMFGFSKQTVDFMQQGRAGIEEMRKAAIESGMALSDEWVEKGAEQARIWNEVGQLISVAGKKFAIVLSEGITGTDQDRRRQQAGGYLSGLPGWVGDYFKEIASGTSFGTESSIQTQSVRPDAQHVNGSSNQKTSQQMTVNVSVDKSGAATTSVKGVDRKNVSTNVYPYKVAQ
jgi:hypothetical protein